MKNRPQKPEEKDHWQEQLRQQGIAMKRKTEDCTLYSVIKSDGDIDGMESQSEAIRIAKETGGQVWACFKEDNDYVRAYPITTKP